jgi:hypothetical protein
METQANYNELYPGHAEEMRKREDLAARLDRAHAAVLPGALREAFGGEPARANGHELQPVTLGLTANLERIKSPLLDVVRIMREVFSRNEAESSSSPDKMAEVRERIGKEIQFQEEQVAETCFVFVCPQKRVRKLLDAGRDKFRDAAMEELGDKLHPAQMAALQRACAQHYVASFATIISYGSPPPEGDAVVFRQPSPGEVTGSAGG